MSKLDNWYISKTSSDPYKAPELWKSVLCGIVTGDKRFLDGYPIHTSTIEFINLEEKWAVTKSGTRYELGVIKSDWLKWIAEEGYTLDDFVKPILQRAADAAGGTEN